MLRDQTVPTGTQYRNVNFSHARVTICQSAVTAALHCSPDVGLVVLLHAHPPAAGARAGPARPDRGLARRPLALDARRGERGQPAQPLGEQQQRVGELEGGEIEALSQN